MFEPRSFDQKRVLWLEAVLFIFIIAIAAFLRFYQIRQIPPGLFPDEATHALDALEVLDGRLSIYSPNEGSTGTLWRYLLALNFAIFGRSILALRAFASAVGVLSVGMAYLVVRELSLAPPVGGESQESARGWAKGSAALAALLLAVSYWHVDLSRMAFSAILMLLVQDVSFFCLWRALASGRQHWFVLFGLSLGALAYNYLPGKLVPVIPLIFFLLQWLIARRDALLVKYWRPLLAAGGLMLVVALPFVVFALLNYQILLARATVLPANVVSPISPLQGIVANLGAFGLWPTPWLSGRWEAFFLGPVVTLCFIIGVGVSLVRVQRPAYLFLLIWWLVMLLPGALAPEGAIPNTRRAIGIATVTFAMASLGLATMVSVLFWLGRRLLFRMAASTDRRTRTIPLALTLILGLLLVAQTGAATFRHYFIQWGPSEAAKLTFHSYDLELADLMARQSGAETVYLLPLDSAAGIINPLLDSIKFVYRGQATYDFLPDDEQTMPARLEKLTAAKQIVRLLHWKVTKHVEADPKNVARYYLEKWGRWVDTESYPYFDIETYELDSAPDAFTQVALTPAEVSFEGQMGLTGYAFGDASGLPEDGHSVTAGDLLWSELAWRKTADFSTNYQVALWLEDAAGHVVGRVSKPLLNNLWHQGTGEWVVGAGERDYYLVRVDPATPPGTYLLKAVLYAGEGDGRRLAPLLPGTGADLAVTLGEVMVKPPLTPPEVTTLPIPQRLDLEVGDGLRLLGFDPGFAGPVRPGDRMTLSLWWQTQKPLSKNLAVMVGIGQGERAWPLSEPQPLGGASYPTPDWPAGAVVRTFVDLRLPAAVETGDYNLGLRLLDIESGTPLTDWIMGSIQVTGRARNFEIPPMIHAVGANFGEQVTLLGYDLDLSPNEEGGTARLILYWQAQKEMETAYKVFVHLLDADGVIIAQVDREPQAGVTPTTGWLAGEVVRDEIEMPVTEIMAATQSIAVGLYDPLTGERLSMLDASGVVVGDRVLILVR